MNSRSLKFLIVGVVVVGAMVALFAFGVKQPGSSYYMTVSDFIHQGANAGSNFRINGKVVPDTITRETGGMILTFKMTDGSSVLPVHYEGLVPDTFTDTADVVVEGELGRDGTFLASTLLAKCPSKYEAAGSPESASATQTGSTASPAAGS